MFHCVHISSEDRIILRPSFGHENYLRINHSYLIAFLNELSSAACAAS